MPQRLLLFELKICTLGLEAHAGDAPTPGLVTSGTYPMALVCSCLLEPLVLWGPIFIFQGSYIQR